MTSKLTREQLHERARENVKALKMASRQTAFESARKEILADLQLAELALAAMDSEAKEPISFDEWSRKCALQITLCYPDFREKAQYIWDSARETQHVAPVAMPECFSNAVSALESLYRNGQKQCWHERYTTDMAYASGVLNACRAAMLQASNSPAQSDCCPAQNHVSPEQNSVAPAQSPIDHGYRPECECSRCKATARICAELSANSSANPDCWCRTCRPVVLNDMRFVVCPDCGNKRCPRANDHRNACTGSNEPGQEGSTYPDTPREVK